MQFLIDVCTRSKMIANSSKRDGGSLRALNLEIIANNFRKNEKIFFLVRFFHNISKILTRNPILQNFLKKLPYSNTSERLLFFDRNLIIEDYDHDDALIPPNFVVCVKTHNFGRVLGELPETLQKLSAKFPQREIR